MISEVKISLINLACFLLHSFGFEWFKLFPSFLGFLIYDFRGKNMGSIGFLYYMVADIFLIFYTGKEGLTAFKWGTCCFAAGHTMFFVQLQNAYMTDWGSIMACSTIPMMLGVLVDAFLFSNVDDTQLLIAINFYMFFFALLMGLVMAIYLHGDGAAWLLSYLVFVVSDLLFLTVYLGGIENKPLKILMMFLYLSALTLITEFSSLLSASKLSARKLYPRTY